MMQEAAIPKSNVIAMPVPTDQARDLFAIPGCTFTPIGLVIERGMPIDDWVELGKRIGRAKDSLGIWRGDWINYGQHEYGKKYEAALALTGLKEGTLRDDVWISKAIPLSDRSDKLTSKHYRKLAPLKSKSKIRLWIERAIKGDGKKSWSAARLEKEINRTTTPIVDAEINTQYLDPNYKQFLLDYIASQQSFLNRCTYEPFKPEIQRTIDRAKFQLKRSDKSDYEGVLKSIMQGASTVEEIAEDVPITARDVEVFCERAVGCPRPTKAEGQQRSTGKDYEWRPIGKKNPHGLQPHGIFHKDTISGDDFIDDSRYRFEEDHF